MSVKQSNFECTVICWGIAALVGFAAMVMLYMLAGFDGNQAVFTGGLVGFLLGVILSLFVCRGQTAAADLASGEKPAQRYARQAAEDKARRDGGAAVPSSAGSSATAPSASSTSAASEGHTEAASVASPTSAASGGAAASAGAASSSAAVKASPALAGEAEVAQSAGNWKYEGNTAADAPSGKAAAGAAAAAPKAEAKVESAPAQPSSADVAESKPSTLYDAPPAEGADDLKLISGVGPKLEQTLNELGIYRFEQVAAWGPSDIAWVDNRLRFKGRIERDDWMSQAKVLASGGETEFSARKKK